MNNKFTVLTFNDECTSRDFTNLPDYIEHIESLKAEGRTNFEKPLSHILKIIKKGDVRILLVIFLTDGDDNNNKETA